MKKVIITLSLALYIFNGWALSSQKENSDAGTKNELIEPTYTTSEDGIDEEKLGTLCEELVQNMVYVNGGSYSRGSQAPNPQEGIVKFVEDQRYAEVLPIELVNVSVSDFFICKYEVTQELWEAVMGTNPSHNVGPKLPVEQVSWYDCQEFISKLNAYTGLFFRLPTEAEWELAARAGWMNPVEMKKCINSDKHTKKTGSMKPDKLGLYDMFGNVSEWCADWYDMYYTYPNYLSNPTGPKRGVQKVIRGGDWNNIERLKEHAKTRGVSGKIYSSQKDAIARQQFNPTSRSACDPNKSHDYIGLRLALSPEQ